MTFNLILLPFDSRRSKTDTYSHTVLWCDNTGFAAKLKKELDGKGKPVPEDFKAYVADSPHGTCYGKVTKTRYIDPTLLEYQCTDPLLWVYAKELKPFARWPAISGTWKNRAVWAYLEALPDNIEVALFWTN